MKKLQILRHNTLTAYGEWTEVGEISLPEFNKLDNTNSALKWFRKNGYLLESQKGFVRVEDNGVTLTLLERFNDRVLYIIPYGE